MYDILHATFAKADDGIQAVESLLHHGARAQDISLILPQPQSTGSAQTISPPESVQFTGNPHPAMTAQSVSVPDSKAAIASIPDLPGPAQLPPLRDTPRTDDREDPNAPGYRRDALGAGDLDPKPSKKAVLSGNRRREVVLDAEQGTGLGLGLGLLAGLCVPGIGLIAGSGIIVADLLAGGALAGGIAGGIYGYLIDRGVAHGIAQVMSNHLEGGGTTLSVTVSGALNEAEIAGILKAFGGHLIEQSEHP